jgi:hypothetical protein
MLTESIPNEASGVVTVAARITPYRLSTGDLAQRESLRNSIKTIISLSRFHWHSITDPVYDAVNIT